MGLIPNIPGVPDLPNIPGLPNIPDIPNIPSVGDLPGLISGLLGNVILDSCQNAGDNSSLSDPYAAPTFHPDRYIQNLHGVPRYPGDSVWSLYSDSYAWGIYGAGITIACVGLVFTLLLGFACLHLQLRGGCGVPSRKAVPKTKTASDDAADSSAAAGERAPAADGVAANTAAATAALSGPEEVRRSRRLLWAFYVMGALTIGSMTCMMYGLWKANVEVDNVADQVYEIADVLSEANQTMYEAVEIATSAIKGSAVVLAYGTLGCSGILGSAADAVVSKAESQAEGLQENWQATREEYLESPADDIRYIADEMTDSKTARDASVITFMVVGFLGMLLMALQVTAQVHGKRPVFGFDQPSVAAGSVAGTGTSFGTGVGTGAAASASVNGASDAAAAGSRRALKAFGRWTMCVAGLLLLLSYACVAAAFMSSLFAADYCIDPNGLTINAFGGDNKLTRQLVDYYTSCNITGTASNPIGEELVAVQCYSNNIAGILAEFDTDKLPNRCGETEDAAATLQTELLELSSLVGEATDLAACSNINPLYVDLAFNSVCHEAVTWSFWVWLGGALYIIFLTVYMFLARAIVLRARRGAKAATAIAAAAGGTAAGGDAIPVAKAIDGTTDGGSGTPPEAEPEQGMAVSS